MTQIKIDKISFLEKREFKYRVWNKKLKEWHEFIMEQTMLPKDTEEGLERMALFKLKGLLSDRPNYDKGKIERVKVSL